MAKKKKPATKAATPAAATGRPGTKAYRVHSRTLDITGAGLFRPGDVAWLTDAQYAADKNSLQPIDGAPQDAANRQESDLVGR